MHAHCLLCVFYDRLPVLLAAAVTLLVVPMPASAYHNVDLEVTAYWLEMTDNGGGKDYTHHLTLCNNGQLYQPAWDADYALFGGETGKHSSTQQYTNDVAACTGSTTLDYTQESASVHDHCCGSVEVYTIAGAQEDDTTNNAGNWNIGTAAILAGETMTFAFAMHNWESSTAVFGNSVGGMTEGWSVTILDAAVTIGAGEQGFARYQITAPDPVTTWPDLTFTSSVTNRPGLTQLTHHYVRDDGNYDSKCSLSGL